MPFSLLLAGLMMAHSVAGEPPVVPSLRPIAATWVPGRAVDAQVAAIVARLAHGDGDLCPAVQADMGLVLQHLSQFAVADRPAVAASQSLDRGPEVIVVVADGPAAAAGVRPGDILLAVDGMPVPPDLDPAAMATPAAVRSHADAVTDQLVAGGATPRRLGLLRDGQQIAVTVTPRLGCLSLVHLARSGQRNAYADGRHVFLTTGLLAQLSNEDELAFVIAHEMAHNILGHAALTRSAAVRHGPTRLWGHSGAILRQTEHDADRLGGRLMLAAGFDPVVGAAAIRRLTGADWSGPLFDSHESAAARVAAMRHLVAEAGR